MEIFNIKVQTDTEKPNKQNTGQAYEGGGRVDAWCVWGKMTWNVYFYQQDGCQQLQCVGYDTGSCAVINWKKKKKTLTLQCTVYRHKSVCAVEKMDMHATSLGQSLSLSRAKVC